MPHKLIGSMDVLGSKATTNSKNLARSVFGNDFDSNGNVVIDSYTKDEFTQMVSVMPVSQYGSFTYMPPGVSGSFEGAAENQALRYRKLFIENDGTLTILRPGTNGAVRNIYYSYLDNGITTSNLNSAVNSNKIYKPGYFGTDYTAYQILPCSEGIVAGTANRRTNNPAWGYVFVSFCNGTLNDSQHTGNFIQTTIVQPNGGTLRFVLLGNTDVYFFNEINLNNGLQIEIRSIPISALQSTSVPVTTLPTEYTWTTSAFYNRTIQGNSVMICERASSNNINDFPYMLIPASAVGSSPFMTGIDIYCKQRADGKIRMRVVSDCWCTSTSYSTRPKSGFSMVIDPVARTAAIESGVTAPLTITDTGSAYTVSGTLFNDDALTTIATSRGNVCMSYYHFDNGTALAVGTPNLGENAIVLRAIYPNVTSIYDALDIKNKKSTNYVVGRMYTTYGSPVGRGPQGLEWLPGNRYRLMSYDGNGAIVNSINEYKPNPTFTFNSVSFGTLKGLEPTTNRFKTAENNRVFINTVAGSTVTSNGGILVESGRFATARDYDMNGVGTGGISIDKSLLTNLRLQQLQGAPVDLNNSSNLALFVPQQPDMPAFAYISASSPTLTYYCKVIEVEVNTRSGVISTLTFKRLVHERSDIFGNLAANSNWGLFATSVAGLSIWDTGTSYLIGGCDPQMYAQSGNAASVTWRARVQKSTKQFDHFTIETTYNPYQSGNFPGAFPGVGFGYFTTADDGCRIIFVPRATTDAQYDAWVDGPAYLIAAGQDVAQGFVVYFNEATPVLLSGKSFTLPVTTIDLHTVKANPANTTFYVYVKMIQGLAQYYITDTAIAESGTTSYNTLWVGTITTNATQIDRIEINKRNRLDVFGASLTATGSSIPVSYGPPTGTGTINW